MDSLQNREAGDELRELYRKTIAAGFTSQPGELSADQVIEDIFSGGDGFGGRRDQPDKSSEHNRSQDGGYWSEGELRPSGGDKGSWTDFTYSKRSNARVSHEPLQSSEDAFRSSAINRPRGSFGATNHPVEMDKGWTGSVPEVDELDVRDDLRCWNSKT
jgi:hypothetical protein